MRKSIIYFFVFSLITHSIFSQSNGVGIGTKTPHATAAFEISDTAKGILIPRMTMNKRLAIQNPAEGLMVYQTDSSKGFYFYSVTQWLKIANKISVDTLSTNNFSALKLFDSPGTYSWEVPAGVTKIIAEIWAAGGGSGGNGGSYRLYTTGGWIYSNGGSGAVGGKGGYNKITMNVTPGQTFSIKVGAAGSSGTNGSSGENSTSATAGSTGGAGGDSFFGSTIAAGGSGGGGGGGGYQSGYNAVANGANGVVGTDGAVLNYTYTYNSFQLLRSYIPAGYIPIYPTSQSNPGENGLVLVFMDN